MSDVNTAPMGGTELILANLKRALPKLTDQVQIIMSRPESVEHEDKPRVLWLQDLPNDPASRRLADPTYRTKFNRIVFCSDWQQQMYNLILRIPFSEGVVIRNAVPYRPFSFEDKSRDIPCGADEQQCDAACRATHEKRKLQFIYTSTPHRGLVILAAAADQLSKERQDWELHVYSSFKIYGWHDQDAQMQPLYERLKENPCVVYHGSVPNDHIREALRTTHVFVYPSIYQETSCMAVQEALMSGCLAITSNLGGLIETCGSWPWMIPFSERPETMALHTYMMMKRALDVYDEPWVSGHLQHQVSYYQNFYSFEARVPAWKALLESVIAEGPPREKLIIE